MQSFNDVHPWVIQLQCDGNQKYAVWQLADGRQSLALFSTEANAEHYRHRCLTLDWNISQPSEMDLAILLIGCHQNDIPLAVIDPNEESAKLMFSIPEVLRSLRSKIVNLKTDCV